MTVDGEAPRETVADASALINLFASGREQDILRAAARKLVVAEVTAAEACFILGPPDGEGVEPKIPIDLVGLERAGLLRVQPMLPEFSGHLIAAAAELRDHDALPVAIAVGLKVDLWSDDAKQTRVARALASGIGVVSTLAILRLAVERLALSSAEVSAVALQVRTRGRFLPPRRDPDAEWFARALEGTATAGE